VRLAGGGSSGQRAADGGGTVRQGDSEEVKVPGSSLGSMSTESTSQNGFFCLRARDLFHLTSVFSVSKSDVYCARTHSVKQTG